MSLFPRRASSLGRPARGLPQVLRAAPRALCVSCETMVFQPVRGNVRSQRPPKLVKRAAYGAKDYHPGNNSYGVGGCSVREADGGAQERLTSPERLDSVVDVLQYFQGLRAPSNIVYSRSNYACFLEASKCCTFIAGPGPVAQLQQDACEDLRENIRILDALLHHQTRLCSQFCAHISVLQRFERMGISIVEAEQDREKVRVSMEMLDRVRRQIHIYAIGCDLFSAGLEHIKMDMERAREDYARQSRARVEELRECRVDCGGVLENVAQQEKIYETMQNGAKGVDGLREIALNEARARALQQQRISGLCALGK